MYDNKTLKVQSTRETLFPVCVCVCACVRVCVRVPARVCVCACAARSKTDKQRTLLSFGASKRSNTHKTCKKNSRLEVYSLKYSLYLKVNENSWEKIVCQYFVLK